MEKERALLKESVEYLRVVAGQKRRILYMPGDERYQPNELKPFLGYDMWAAWLIIVEWFWLLSLAKIGVLPERDSRLLTRELLFHTLRQITTKMQDKVERGDKAKAIKGTNHDILALLVWMRRHLPRQLHKWLHFGATSYDIICTAYALMMKSVYEAAFMPKLLEVDGIWRARIAENCDVLEAGRTHLQTALPVTVGFWLANLHNRFVRSARKAEILAGEIPGKFSGAVGTSASQRALISSHQGEKVLMKMLALPVAEISTQIAPPEGMARFYFELVLLSGAMANLGEDVRILQSSMCGELITDSSTSSAMPHKRANPIAAENDAGMHVSVIAENMKVVLTLVSDLQRDLRWSNVMRSFSATAVYTFQQILTTERILRSLQIDAERCRKNFDSEGRLVVAELLHLTLQREGYANTHHLVNKEIVPRAAKSGNDLVSVMDGYVGQLDMVVPPLSLRDKRKLYRTWKNVPSSIKRLLRHPEKYLGDAVRIAKKEAKNKL